MNLVDSVKFVLRKKSPEILSSVVKEDFFKIIKDFSKDILQLRNKKSHFKSSLAKAVVSAQLRFLLIKEVPNRIQIGFKTFKEDFILEIEKLSDQKQRTKFCMKVLAGLSKFALSSVYSVGMDNKLLIGFGKSKYSQVLMSQLLFKTIQSFIVRFIEEIEKEVTDVESLKNLQLIKGAILDDKGNAIDKVFEGVTDSNDPAYKIVEKLKIYILTGEAVSMDK